MPPSERISRAVLELSTDNKQFNADLVEAEARAKGIQQAFIQVGAGVSTNLGKVNDLVREFSGLPAVQRAEEFAGAIQKIGGASRLTADDQKRVNKEVAEALDHYRALGQEAPAHLVKLEKATRGVHESTGLLDESFMKMTAAFGAGALLERAASGLFEFGKSIVEDAGHLVDLSEKTGLSTDALQVYGQIAKETGSTVDGVADSVFTFGLKVAEGTTEFKKAVTDAGLSLATLQGQTKDEAFAAVVTRLHDIGDEQERDRLGAALLGKTYKEIKASIVEGLDSIKDHTVIVANAQLKAIDDMADKWSRFWDNLKKQSMAAAGAMVTDVQTAASGWSKLFGDVEATFSGGFGGGFQGAAKAHVQYLKDLAEKQRTAAAATDERTRATGKGAGADDEAAKKAKAYADAVAAVEKKLSGAATREEIQKTADAVAALHGRIADAELPALAKQLIDWQKAGFALPPVLEAIRAKQQALNDLLEAALKDDADYVAGVKSRTQAEEALNDILAKRVDLSKLPGATTLAAPFGGAADYIRSITSRYVPKDILSVGTRASLGDKPAEDAALKFGAKYSQTLINSLSGGGSPFKAIGSQLGTDLGTTLAKKLAPKAVGAVMKGVVGAIPVIGGLAGPAIDLIAMAFHNEGADANKLRDSMKASLGGDAGGKGLESLVAKYKESTQVQTAYAAFLAAKTKDTVQKAFDDLKGALDKSTTDVEAKASRIADALGTIGTANANVTGGSTAGFAKKFEQLTGFSGAEAADVIKRYKDIKAQMKAVDDKTTPLLGDVLGRGQTADEMDQAERLYRQWDDLKKQLDEIAPAYHKIADANKQIVAGSQDEFDRLSRITLASFNAYVGQGKTAVEAITAIGPAFDNLAAAADQFGFAGSAAFDKLRSLRTIVEENQPVLDQVAGLNELLKAMSTLGAVDAATFADIQAQGLSAFKTLTDAGLSQQEAEAQLAPLLATILDLHDKTGLAIDENTQALIDQATTDGQLKRDTKKDLGDVVTAIERVADILEGKAKRAFGGLADEATTQLDRINRKAADVASGITDQFSGMNFDVNVGYRSDGFSADAGGGYPGYAKGTPNLSYARFSRRGQLAVMHGDEAAVPRSAVGSLAGDIADRLGDASTAGGWPTGDLVLNVGGRMFWRGNMRDLVEASRGMQATKR